jgi:hypothetical protein
MGFLRREPLHQRLAREGGLHLQPLDTGPGWGEVGIHGVARPREWDAVTLVEAEIAGEQARFVALPDRTLVVEEGPDDVSALAAGIERSLAPPYRAEAVRREAGWAVAARRIRVVDLPELDGDELELTVSRDGRRLMVDGAQSFGSARQLEELLGERHGVVRAVHLDGDAYEVQVHEL